MPEDLTAERPEWLPDEFENPEAFAKSYSDMERKLTEQGQVREDRAPELVTLVGVPGIGKSRLVFELFKVIESEPEQIRWRQGRCLPYRDGVSFWALGEIVKAQAGILESDAPEQAEQKLCRAVAEVVTAEHEVPWVEQQLRPLVGLGGELGSGERSGEAFPAWRRFIEELADVKPLVLVFEDLHWADEGLLDFVDELGERVRDAPLLVVCTARPELIERRSGWGGGKANSLTISLPPLSDDETARLVAAVLGQPLLEVDVHEAVLARAAGNPLYAEQFARVLTEIGSLDELPETVHGIIAARLDGLAPAEKALLQDAAVVGKVFWLGAIEAMGDTPRSTEELLVGLERKEFVQQARRSSVAGEAEYAFRHVLLRDVAYGQIPRAIRGEKHGRAAAWIESLGRPEDHAEMLAHHYLSALEYTKAAGREDRDLVERGRLALRAAGDRALALASYPAAVRFYDAALALWPQEDPARVWLLVHAGRASFGADGTGIELLEQGFEQLHASGDAESAAEVAVEVARCFIFRAERDTAYAYVDRALELVQGSAWSRAKTRVLVERAAYHMSASEYSEAIRVAQEALPLTEAHRMDAWRARALDVLGAARAMSGDVRGLEDSRRAISLAREANAFAQLIRAQENLYSVQFGLGQLDAAWKTAAAYLRDVDRYGPAFERTRARGLEAYEAFHHGRWEEAERTLDDLIAAAETGVPHYMEATRSALRASMALARGDLEAAGAGSEKALDRARGAKEPHTLAPTLALRAIVLVAQGLLGEASELISEVLALRDSPVDCLLTNSPAATPIDFTWLLRDLDRETELLPALESVPSTPWAEAARAIAHGHFAVALEIVARLGLPAVEAYTRLRTAEELARAGWQEEADECLAPAVTFFRNVGATRYLTQAEELLAGSG